MQPSSTLKITLPILGIVVIGAIAFYFLQKSPEPTEVSNDQATVGTPTQGGGTSANSETPEPQTETVSFEDAQVEIKAIAAEVDAGTITQEEAQAKMDELSKKMPPPPLPPEATANN